MHQLGLYKFWPMFDKGFFLAKDMFWVFSRLGFCLVGLVPGRGLGMEILYLRLLDKMNDEKIFMTSECAIMPM